MLVVKLANFVELWVKIVADFRISLFQTCVKKAWKKMLRKLIVLSKLSKYF